MSNDCTEVQPVEVEVLELDLREDLTGCKLPVEMAIS